MPGVGHLFLRHTVRYLNNKARCSQCVALLLLKIAPFLPLHLINTLQIPIQRIGTFDLRRTACSVDSATSASVSLAVVLLSPISSTTSLGLTVTVAPGGDAADALMRCQHEPNSSCHSGSGLRMPAEGSSSAGASSISSMDGHGLRCSSWPPPDDGRRCCVRDDPGGARWMKEPLENDLCRNKERDNETVTQTQLEDDKVTRTRAVFIVILDIVKG